MIGDTSITARDDWKVQTWVAGLRAVSVFNILLWGFVCVPLIWSRDALSLHVALSGVYVAVCAFRSALPRIDLERYSMEDSVWSSAAVGRTAATIAEVCFATQIALCIHQIGTAAGVPWVVTAAYFVVPPLALAQVFCWHSVVTLSHFGHAVESMLWTATFAGVGVALGATVPYLEGDLLMGVYCGIGLSLGFVAFMLVVDLPMYVARWRQSHSEHRRFLNLREGFRDAVARRVVTREWSDWKQEVPWLTGYFSLGVWLSIYCVRLVHP